MNITQLNNSKVILQTTTGNKEFLFLPLLDTYNTQVATPAISRYQALEGHEVLLGRITANMNITTDQAITINRENTTRKFIITRIVVTNASTSLTTAAGGVYPAVSKGGTAIVAAAQAYSSLTGPTIVLNTTLAVNRNYDINTIYFSLTTAQGAAATADVLVYGFII
jgi:hypothetical protein